MSLMLVIGEALLPNITSVRLVLIVFNDKGSPHQVLRVVTFLASIALRAESLLLDGKTGGVITATAVTLACPVSSGPELLRDCKNFKPIRRFCYTSQTNMLAFVCLVKIFHSNTRDKSIELVDYDS